MGVGFEPRQSDFRTWAVGIMPLSTRCSFSSLEEIVQMRAQIMKHRSDKLKAHVWMVEVEQEMGWGSHTPGGLANV